MLDHIVRPYINPPLNLIAKILYSANCTANSITILGFIAGLIAMLLISINYYLIGALFILLNRLFDGLDGPLARLHTTHHIQSKHSDFGGFLDITCDFIIYSGIVLSFGLAEPQNLWAANILVFSFVGTMASFLAYAVIAAKHGIHTEKRGKKSFYFIGGICEGTETFIALIAMCLWPEYFNTIAIVFSVLCWLTTSSRVYQAWCDFT